MACSATAPIIDRALRAVEARIVEATWAQQRLPDPDRRFQHRDRHGLAYANDLDDLADEQSFGQPRPGTPSPRSIDAIDDVMDWLEWLPVNQRRLVALAAVSKRGDVDRNVRWNRVRSALPELDDLTTRTLQRQYDAGLREIYLKLSLGR